MRTCTHLSWKCGLWRRATRSGILFGARNALYAEVVMSRLVQPITIVVLILVALCPVGSSAQTPANSADDPARREAFQLYDAGKYVDAMPRLEQIVADHPSDLVAKEHWAFSMIGYAASLPDP